MGKLWILTLLMLWKFTLTSAAYKCNTKNFYCLTKDVYYFCIDGSNTTNTEPLVCPTGTKCSAGCDEPCFPDALFPCEYKCKLNEKNEQTEYEFHCVNETSFRLCTGSDTPDPEVSLCTSEFKCNKFCDVPCSKKPCVIDDCEDVNTKFIVDKDNSKNYYQCVDIDGIRTGIKYTCPGTSYFDKDKNLCKKPTPTKECETEGRFVDPQNNTRFILCVYKEGKYEPYYINCSPGTVFNHTSSKCTKSSTGVQPSTVNPNQFQCHGEGNIANPNSCRQYYICIKDNETGKYTSTPYTCPSNTYFNPETKRCSATPPPHCPELLRDANYNPFICAGTGRFPDPHSCLHYYLCSLVDDDFEVHHFPCPGNSHYNPSTKECTYIPDSFCG